jgi:hypothetical protein
MSIEVVHREDCELRSPLCAKSFVWLALWLGAGLACAPGIDPHYPIVGTGQDHCFNERGSIIDCPIAGQPLWGQDAQHPGNRPQYHDNGDATVTGLVTGLVWAKAPSAPLAFADVGGYARASRLGGHEDWRVPTIRELYSLIDYRGGYSGDPATSRPYIDVTAFDFAYATQSFVYEGLGVDSAYKDLWRPGIDWRTRDLAIGAHALQSWRRAGCDSFNRQKSSCK